MLSPPYHGQSTSHSVSPRSETESTDATSEHNSAFAGDEQDTQSSSSVPTLTRKASVREKTDAFDRVIEIERAKIFRPVPINTRNILDQIKDKDGVAKTRADFEYLKELRTPEQSPSKSMEHLFRSVSSGNVYEEDDEARLILLQTAERLRALGGEEGSVGELASSMLSRGRQMSGYFSDMSGSTSEVDESDKKEAKQRRRERNRQRRQLVDPLLRPDTRSTFSPSSSASDAQNMSFDDLDDPELARLRALSLSSPYKAPEGPAPWPMDVNGEYPARPISPRALDSFLEQEGTVHNLLHNSEENVDGKSSNSSKDKEHVNFNDFVRPFPDARSSNSYGNLPTQENSGTTGKQFPRDGLGIDEYSPSNFGDSADVAYHTHVGSASNSGFGSERLGRAVAQKLDSCVNDMIHGGDGRMQSLHIHNDERSDCNRANSLEFNIYTSSALTDRPLFEALEITQQEFHGDASSADALHLNLSSSSAPSHGPEVIVLQQSERVSMMNESHTSNPATLSHKSIPSWDRNASMSKLFEVAWDLPTTERRRLAEASLPPLESDVDPEVSFKFFCFDLSFD
jgi:hypothetical protein